MSSNLFKYVFDVVSILLPPVVQHGETPLDLLGWNSYTMYTKYTLDSDEAKPIRKAIEVGIIIRLWQAQCPKYR